MGEGSHVSFWHDPWCGPTPLKELFPTMYACSLSKEAWVSNLVVSTSKGSRSWNLLFHHGPQDWEAATVYSFFEFIYSSMPRGEGDDQLLWRFTTSGVFDAHSFYKLLFGPNTDAIPWECIWCTKMPKWVSIFLWITANDGILTIDNLGCGMWRRVVVLVFGMIHEVGLFR